MADVTTAGGARMKPRPAVEIPTLLLVIFVYATWLAATANYSHLSLLVSIPLIALLITLHSSLQHEMTHGHPTRWRPFNCALAMIPLSLWVPFERYLHTHHAHHVNARLTDPVDDPETFYWEHGRLQNLHPISRVILKIDQTLAGRLLVGSTWRIWLFLCGEFQLLRRNEKGVRKAWLIHLLLCVPVVLWVKFGGIPLWLYFIAMVVPANAIQLIRSFAEHRAHPDVPARVAIVESSWLLGPIFLFNNLHSLHHESPGIPWYQCPAQYRANRARLIAENQGLVYSTYFEVARRFLFKPHDVLRHPMGRIPARTL